MSTSLVSAVLLDLDNPTYEYTDQDYTHGFSWVFSMTTIFSQGTIVESCPSKVSDTVLALLQ
jgi:hypothetical protein